MEDFWRRVVDLHVWEIETQRELPLSAQNIASLELCGYIIDLETGCCFKQIEVNSDIGNIQVEAKRQNGDYR